MEESLKFNSQICTTKEQSQRILDLGLKPETADFMYFAMSKSYHGTDIPTRDRRYNLVLFFQDEIPITNHEEYEYIPAWSLHRLIELMDVYEVILEWKFGIYECAISMLEERIKDGLINKEYLKKTLGEAVNKASNFFEANFGKYKLIG